jgi:hypothetical protein
MNHEANRTEEWFEEPIATKKSGTARHSLSVFDTLPGHLGMKWEGEELKGSTARPGARHSKYTGTSIAWQGNKFGAQALAAVGIRQDGE